jgi:hypothetical protein
MPPGGGVVVASWVRVADELPCEVWERVSAIMIVMRRLIIVYPFGLLLKARPVTFLANVDDGGKE